MNFLEDAASRSEVRYLSSLAPLDRAVERMKAELSRDLTAEVREKVRAPDVAALLSRYWYQRVDLGRLGVTSKSNHEVVPDLHGGNPLHTLYGRLTTHEGNLAQPYTKWDYLREILPDLNGKTVLEIGSANGFFSLEFATRGASVVNGIESWTAQVDMARIVAGLRGVTNVNFHGGDAFYDEIEPHDVVFISEVLNHSCVATHGFLRLLGLAKETLIFDEFTTWDQQASDALTVVPTAGGQVQWTGTCLSEYTILTLCHLAGVDASRVLRWRDDRDPDYQGVPHTTFIIDTRDAARNRPKVLGSDYLVSAVEGALGIRRPRRIPVRV